MNCSEARNRLNDTSRREVALDAELSAHVGSCELCRIHYADRVLDATLDAFEVPEPDAGFVDRAIATASAGQRRSLVPMVALAATIAAFGIATGVMLGRGAASDVSFEVAMAPFEERFVEVVIDAAEGREQAMLTITLEADLELSGFPEQRVVSWRTDLAAGKNLLALPLRLRSDADSHFTVGMTHGSVEKTLHVEVRAKAQSPGDVPRSV